MNQKTSRLTISGLCIALGLVLPFLTGQIPQIGSMLLPMHIPVFLCGLICGWQYGLAVGFIVPLLRSVLFTMPPFFPTAISMAFELATYGLVTGLLFGSREDRSPASLYKAIVAAMLAGRVVWGAVQTLLLTMNGGAMTFEIFLTSGFLNAIPGIVVQLTLIPALIVALDRSGLLLPAPASRSAAR